MPRENSTHSIKLGRVKPSPELTMLSAKFQLNLTLMGGSTVPNHLGCNQSESTRLDF